MRGFRVLRFLRVIGVFLEGGGLSSVGGVCGGARPVGGQGSRGQAAGRAEQGPEESTVCGRWRARVRQAPRGVAASRTAGKRPEAGGWGRALRGLAASRGRRRRKRLQAL